MAPGRPEPPRPPQTLGQRVDSDLAEMREQMHNLLLHRQRMDRMCARMLERIDKLERKVALLAQIQGELALQASDDLEMEPGVKVWTPEDMDE